MVISNKKKTPNNVFMQLKLRMKMLYKICSWKKKTTILTDVIILRRVNK